ncbi:hypothetical protein ACFX2F_025761 [Malus domestica]
MSDAMEGRVLIDNELKDNFLFMGVTRMMDVVNKINFKRSIIQAFNRVPHNTMGTMQLKVQAKSSEYLMAFHVIDSSSPYNVIIGQE